MIDSLSASSGALVEVGTYVRKLQRRLAAAEAVQGHASAGRGGALTWY